MVAWGVNSVVVHQAPEPCDSAATSTSTTPAPRAALETFSDGVFAIAITLLIIEIGVPVVDSDESLSDALWHLWPAIGAYILSFLTIGIYWANHNAFFRLFVRTDHIFLMLNVVFLMCIAFVPFPTAVLGEYLDDAPARHGRRVLRPGPAAARPRLVQRLGVRERPRPRGRALAPGYVRFLTGSMRSQTSSTRALSRSPSYNAWVALVIAAG